MPEPEDHEAIAGALAANVRSLRSARGLTQAQIAKLAGVPRATWANLETGSANPTLSVLHAAARALGVSLEELLSPPRAAVTHHLAASLAIQERGAVRIRKLLPDPLPATMIDRMELAPGGRMTGVPHTAGTREYLTVESGEITVAVGGERFVVAPGDVLAFRGDQRHSYANLGARPAIGYSVVILVARV